MLSFPPSFGWGLVTFATALTSRRISLLETTTLHKFGYRSCVANEPRLLRRHFYLVGPTQHITSRIVLGRKTCCWTQSLDTNLGFSHVLLQTCFEESAGHFCFPLYLSLADLQIAWQMDPAEISSASCMEYWWGDDVRRVANVKVLLIGWKCENWPYLEVILRFQVAWTNAVEQHQLNKTIEQKTHSTNSKWTTE